MDPTQCKKIIPLDLQNLSIIVKVFKVEKVDRTNYENTSFYTINLNKIDDDFESLLVRKAKDTLEFEVEHMEFQNVVIEGIVRYYPYQHQEETIPRLSAGDELSEGASVSGRSTTTEDHLIRELQRNHAAKPQTREVFECFWHGRLIPQDCIDFEWSKPSHKSKDKVNDDCFGRIAGALFTNSAFKVSQNKQSFMDLGRLMAQKDCLTFYKMSNDEPPRRLRTNFEAEFMNWLKQCHKKYDKQVHYRKWERDAQRNEFSVTQEKLFE